MLSRRRSWAVVCCAVIVAVLVQIAIFGSVPRGGTPGTKSVIVRKGTPAWAVATSLKDEGLISSATLFRLSSLLLHRGRIVAGEYELTTGMSIFQIARKMALGQRKIYTLKIVEGQNLFDVAGEMEKNGLMGRREFLSLARDRNVLHKIGITEESLEGYLSPDTYFYSRETDIQGFLDPIVQRTMKFFDKDDIRKRMADLALSREQVICFASIIEKEAKLEEEKPLISAVFHNRLRAGMSLDADPTVIYGRQSFDRDLKKIDLITYTPYNTYLMKGLPKGPICNPGKSSLLAVLYPAKSDALYFVSRNNGTHVFSRTLREHSHYVTVYQRNRSGKPQ